ncbi:MAG: AzlC family ABC transporter permease [Acidimicrobiia bacterium]
MNTPSAIARTAVGDGSLAVTPLMLGVVPFGLIFGVTVAATSVSNLAGWASSIVIFGGAAQLVAVELLDQAAPLAVVIVSALAVNARHAMYSAALANPFSEFPRPWRILTPYLLTDQAFAVSIARFETMPDPLYRRFYYLGAAATLWIVWQLGTTVGVLVGTQIPAAWNLDFAIPLVFLAILIPTLTSRPAVLAAVVAAATATAGRGIPNGLGLVIGIVVGIASGVLAERAGA